MPLNKAEESQAEPSGTRTNRDRAMIILGVALIVLFLAVAYFSLEGREKKASPTRHGPVKEPAHSSLQWDRYPVAHNTFGFRGLAPGSTGCRCTESSIENRRSSIG